MKKQACAVLTAVCILLLCIGCVNSDPVLAEWDGHKIQQSHVENHKNTIKASGGQVTLSDDEIVAKLVENTVLLDEAERLGLTATEEEISAMFQASEQAYAMPEGKETIDAYCAEVGITVEDYFALLREQLPRTIARQKLRDHIGKTYCEENGLEFTKVNPPQAMLDAVAQYVDQLVEQADVTYYMNKD